MNKLGAQCTQEAEDRAENRSNAPLNMLPDFPSADGANPHAAGRNDAVTGEPRFNPYAWSDIHSMFSLNQSNDELLESVKPDDPGNSGDLVLCNAQIDYLNMMERAFRARHTMTFPRCIAHHCGRRTGQGSDAGPLRYGVLDYLRDLKKTSSGG